MAFGQGAPQNFLEIRIADLSKSAAILNHLGLRMLSGAESFSHCITCMLDFSVVENHWFRKC